jgi:hypothetical protein
MNFLHKLEIFLLSIYDSNESIAFEHGKFKFLLEVPDELRLFSENKVIFSLPFEI